MSIHIYYHTEECPIYLGKFKYSKNQKQVDVLKKAIKKDDFTRSLFEKESKYEFTFVKNIDPPHHIIPNKTLKFKELFKESDFISDTEESGSESEESCSDSEESGSESD